MDAIQAYRQSEITSENPVHLIVLLYDQLLRDLRRALDAFDKKDIPRRCDELDHALLVLGQLQGTLNHESGGEVAQTLDTFYNVVRDSLVLSTVQGSPDLLKKQWQNILSVREAWLEVERQQIAPAADPARPQSPAFQTEPTAGDSEWSA
jgi:flagellar secretion chaperone FliS